MVYTCVYLKKKTVKEIIVFSDEIENSQNVQYTEPLSKSSPLLDAFTRLNVENLDMNSTIYTQAIDVINDDDTIFDMKMKVSRCLDNIHPDELYTFILSKKKYDIHTVFDILRQNSTDTTFPKERLLSFVQNIKSSVKIPNKKSYNFDDLINIGFSEKDTHILMYTPLGNRYSIRQEYPVIANPFSVSSLDSVLKTNIREIVSTNNNEVLLDQYDINNNVIFVSTLEDVLQHATQSNISLENICKLYFPLYPKPSIQDINDVENFTNTELLADHLIKMKKLNKIKKAFDSQKIDSTQEGIRELKCIYHTLPDNTISLERVFKAIQSSETVPFIKYNPNKQEESYFRIYSADNNGNTKTPYLSKVTIQRIQKEIAKKTSIGMFIPDESLSYSVSVSSILLELYNDGSLMIHTKLSNTVPLDQLNTYIQSKCKTLSSQLQKIADKLNMKIANIIDITDSSVEIQDIVYESTLSTMKVFDISDYRDLLSPVFSYSDAKLTSSKPIHVRYKRISNFSNMDSIHAFISDLTNQQVNMEDILTILMQSYNLSFEDANKTYTDWIEQINIRKNIHNRNKSKLVFNPGFKLLITKNRSTQDISFTLSGINNIQYLDHVSTYLGALYLIGTNEYPKIGDNVAPNSNENKSLDVVSKTESVLEEGIDSVLDNNKIENTPLEDNFFMNFGDDTDDSDDDSETDSRNISDDNVNTNQPREEGKYDDSDTDDDDDDDDVVIGGKYQIVDDEILHDISLRNPNYFEKRLKQRDPIFETRDEKGKVMYSRFCPSQVRRQPVIISEEEKKYIDENNPDAYNYAMQYQSKMAKKPYYYICPKYWCFKTNTPMTLEQIKRGDCGGKTKTIDNTNKSKKIPKDAYAYEFNNFLTKESDGLSVPGMSNSKKIPKDMCIPCCFADGKTDKDMLSSCNAKLYKPGEYASNDISSNTNQKPPVEVKDTTPNKVSVEEKREDKYIMNGDTFPLESGRIGYLPLQLEEILTKDKRCKQSKTFPNTKSCLMRLGIHNDQKQSFLALIAEYYTEYEPNKKKLSISEMKKAIIGAMTLDIFIVLLNGTLPELFREKQNVLDSIDVSQYTDSILYKPNEFTSNPDSLLRFKMTCAAYEKFKTYIQDDVEMDHSYILEFISLPNEKLFPQGLNLYLFQIPNDDSTSKVQIVCPTVPYVQLQKLYNVSKPSVIALKIDAYYEPIILYKNDSKFRIRKVFSNILKDISNIQDIFNVIKKATLQCDPKPSMPNVYTMKRNKQLSSILDILKTYDFDVTKQILNYNERVIAVVVPLSNYEVIVPVYPSNVNLKYPFEYMDNTKNTLDYSLTVNMLKELNRLTEGKILCKPLYRVIENEVIVGIITETDQYVPIQINVSEPIPDNDELQTMYSYDQIKLDKKSLFHNPLQNNKNKLIKKIKLENQFYYAFRNTIRFAIQKYENKKIRDMIMSIVDDMSLFDDDKKKKIYEIIKPIIYNSISFSEFDDNVIMTLPQIDSCFSLNSDQCSKTPYCLVDSYCKLQIPVKHLINKSNNEKQYVDRIIDEFIRYGLLREAIIERNAHILNDDDLDFTISENEVIIVESLLDQLFQNKTHKHTNKYISAVTDAIQPNISKQYTNVYKDSVELKKSLVKSRSDTPPIMKCIDSINDNPSGLDNYFMNKPSEIIINNTALCNFAMMKDIIEEFTNKQVNPEEISKTLVKQYYVFEDNLQNIYDILRAQNKKKLIDKAQRNGLKLEEIIMDENYPLSSTDIILLADAYKIPLVMMTSAKGGLNELKGEKDNKMYVTQSVNLDSPCVFIRQPGLSQQKSVIQYRLISLTYEYKIKIPFSEMKPLLKQTISDAIYNPHRHIKYFIKNYHQLDKIKKKTLKLIKHKNSKTRKK